MARKPRPEAAPTSPDPIEIAMADEASDTRPDSPARRVLLEQEKLIRAQRRNENFGSALKVLTGFAGVAVAAGLALMAWTASRADGLVIRSFSVPPSLAERGITGEAIASGLMDRMDAMNSSSGTGETRQSLQGDFGQTVSLQIPETGISLTQIDQWLRSKLGRERLVTGEVMIGEDGRLILTSRDGGVALPDQTGAASDLPALMQRAAEALFEREQPQSYSSYLSRQGRNDELAAYAEKLISSGSIQSRGRGYHLLAGVYRDTKGILPARTAWLRGLAIDPAGGRGLPNLFTIELYLGHQEAAYYYRRQVLAQSVRGEDETRTPENRRQSILVFGGGAASMVGDFGLALKNYDEFTRAKLQGWLPSVTPPMYVASSLAGLHEIRKARTLIENFDPASPAQIPIQDASAFDVAAAADDWPAALAATDRIIANMAATWADKGEPRKAINGQRALALIQLGRLDEAEAELAKTPLDCQPCIVSRGLLAAAQGNTRLADHWLGEAVKMAPSLPQANYEWGKLLLARGDHAGALARFQAASAKGPNWADPLSGWGEALLAQGRAEAAAKKFEAADKLAPNWGRNHMLWGEALGKLGKAAESRAQYAAAARLDLTAAERGRLTALQGGKP